MSNQSTDLQKSIQLLSKASRILAGVDDGAQSYDDMGYNKVDTHRGQRLAAIPADQWTQEMAFDAYKMLAKYRGQLRGAGLNWEDIPPVKEKSEKTILVGPDGRLEIRFPYHAEMVAALRTCPGRRFDDADPKDKHNKIAVSREAADFLREFLRTYPGFELSPEAVELLRNVTRLPNAPKKPEADPNLPPRRIEVHNQGFAVLWTDPEKEEWRRLLDLVKGLPGRRFNLDGDNANTVPARPDSIKALAKLAKEEGFVWSAEARRTAEAAITQRTDNLEASMMADADYDVPGLGGTLMPFQRAGVKYMVQNERVFNADEMGLGKTVQGLAAALALNGFPLVVVCPASLKYNWKREAEKWLPGKRVYVVEGKNDMVPAYPDVVILNYDILAAYVGELHARKPLTVIFDEAHLLKNYKSQRAQAADDLVNGPAKDVRGYRKARQYKVPYVFSLTGTPVLNRPGELIQPLKVMRLLDNMGGFKHFAEYYCGWQPGQGMNGAYNLSELNETIRREGCFIRRRKAQVLKELPPKVRSVIPLLLDNRHEYDLAEDDLEGWYEQRDQFEYTFQASVANLTGEEQQQAKKEHRQAVFASGAEHLRRISALKQIAARGKVKQILSWIEDWHDQNEGEKLIIFGWHKEIIHAVAKALAAPVIDGGVTSADRDAIVQRFQNDPSCLDIVLNIQAGGVGLTLTASSTVVFLEQAWRPGDHDQAEDRAHRIGQQGTVFIYYFIGEGTIDEDIYNLISNKRLIVDESTDGGETMESLRKAIEQRVSAKRKH